MKFFSLLGLASLATALSVPRAADPLDVKIEVVGNTAVHATITNTGSEALKILKTGSILDTAPVEKVKVFKGDSQVEFAGVRLRMTTTNLSDDVFQTIAAGESIKADFDIAEFHDLSSGGTFDLVSSGTLSYAAADSNELEGAVSFSSNSVSATVDGAEAAAVRRRWEDKRSTFQSDCTGSKGTAQRTAHSNCASLARAAASAATSNSAKVVEYFKSASASSTLVTVFNRVASECGSTTSGVARQYCNSDPASACRSNVLAYTVPSQSYMVSCPLYFSDLPALTRSCHAQDQATTTLHEATHLSQIKGTDDLGYGYAAASRLSSSQALNNADSYALFANAIYAGC